MASRAGPSLSAPRPTTSRSTSIARATTTSTALLHRHHDDANDTAGYEAGRISLVPNTHDDNEHVPTPKQYAICDIIDQRRTHEQKVKAIFHVDPNICVHVASGGSIGRPLLQSRTRTPYCTLTQCQRLRLGDFSLPLFRKLAYSLRHKTIPAPLHR